MPEEVTTPAKSPIPSINEKYDIWERAILRLGFPTIMVVVGLLFYAGVINSPVTRAEATLNLHTSQSLDLIDEARKHTRLLHRMCLAAARSPSECLDAATLPPAESARFRASTPAT